MPRSRLMFVLALMSSLVACGSDPSPATQPKQEAPAVKPELPAGLVAFDDGKAPLTTALPSERAAHQVLCDDTGCRYVFGLSDDAGVPRGDASVTFFFPSGSPELTTLRDEVVHGDGGVFANNPAWVPGQKSGGHPSMPWLQEVISFSAGETTVGRVMIGQAPMGNFVVTEVLNKEELEDARPIIAAIYTHLAFPKR